jgi:hypothetical protein
MQVTINIECDNAAFRPDAGTELARILRDLAVQVDGKNLIDFDQVTLTDNAGNKVGQMKAEGKLYPDPSAENYIPASEAGTLGEMLELLRTGVTVMVDNARIWVEPGTIVVAEDDEDDDRVEFLLTLGGLSLALNQAGYEGKPA